MSAEKEAQVKCDNCNRVKATTGKRIRNIRRSLAGMGWTSVMGPPPQDFCPVCSKTPGSENYWAGVKP